MHTRSVTATVCLGLLAATAPIASADFLGSTVSLDAYYPNLDATPISFGSAVVADPAVEFPDVFDLVWASDVTGATILLDHFSSGNNLGPADFNGFVFTFTDLSTPIESVSLAGSSTLVPTDFWVTGDQVFVDYAGFGTAGVSFTMLEVTFIPVPGAAALLGFGAIAAGRRRR